MRILLVLIFPFFLIFNFEREDHLSSSLVPLADTLTATDSILHFWLKKEGVDDEKPIAKTFYFWTSPQELDSVEKQHALLRSQTDNTCALTFYSEYRKALENKKWNKFPVANYLREGRLGRTRSAWPCYWSTLISDTAYCSLTQLVKVELEDSALIAVFRPQNKIPWQVFDLSGNIISAPEIEKRHDQIAAVYYSDHINARKGCISSYANRPAYYNRTFFLCNENMIKGWHHAVPGMQQKILDDLKYLLLLDAYLGSDVKKTMGPGKDGKNVVSCWSGETKNFSVAKYYFRTQCYASTLKPEAFPFAIDEIIGTLRYRWPKQIHPMEKFPSKGMR
jgi:hypothetical protein